MIRKALKKDINSINELGLLVTPNFLKTYNIDNYINNTNYIVLVNEDEFVNAFLIMLKNIDCYEIEMIVVNKNYRNMHIASNLIEHFIKKYAKINDIILLEVASNNENAIKLYKKFNFEVINTRKGYYNGTDALIMKRVI